MLNSWIILFLVFFKVGLFTIGGGLAALPLLQEEMVDGEWVTEAEFVDMIAVSQSTPGPIGINMATYAGYKAASVPGALIATAGMVAPSLIIILLIARFMRDFAEHRRVQDALGGIRPAAVGLIAAAAWFVAVKALTVSGAEAGLPWGLQADAALLAVTLGLARWRWRRLHPVVFIAAGAVIGVVLL